ncbi:gliding motility-associated C-terminal domain-containing protein [Mucilaginibacter sp. AW1-3]
MRKLLLSGLFSVVLILSLPDYSFAQTGQPITICSGASIVIQGDAVSPTPSNYQWELSQNGSWVNAPGVYNGADYPPSLLVNASTAPIIYSIRRKVVIAGVTKYDSYYDVTTLPSAAISNNVITTPSPSAFCSPGTPAIINGSTPAGGNGSFTYQWQSSTDNSSFSNIAGATALSYTPPTLLVTTYYRRITFGSSCVATSISNVVTITVFPNVSNNTITAPAVNSFCLPSDPASIVGNTPAGGSGSYTYQWQSSADGVTFTDMPGITTRDYDPPMLSATTYYRRTAISGACTTPVISNVISISILNTPINNVITSPATTSFCQSGDPANIQGNTPSGGNGVYTYQWQQSTDNINFTNISGASAKDYDPATISVTTYYRRTVVSGSCTTPVISNVVTINVIAPPPVPLTVQPPVVTVCPGSPATLSVTNPQSGITYKWYDSPAKTNLLYTGDTYVTGPITVATTFYVESSNGLCSSPSAASVQVNLAPTPTTPVLTNNPVSTCTGTSATLTIANPQAGVTYNWYTTATGNTVLFSGTSFTTPVLSANTTYYVEATNGGGCISTRIVANVTILPVLPALTNNSITAPAVTSFCSAGDPANIVGSSPAGGNNVYTYQWQQSTDNVTFSNISGANAKDYDPATISVTTYYRRIISSGQCTTPVVSNAVTITIMVPPAVPLTVQPPVVTVCPGSPATLSVSNPQSGITYKWYDSAAKTNLLFTGDTYVTGPVTLPTTFYVESSNGLCSSPTSASVQVNIAPTPTTPVLVNNPVSICTGTSGTLSISNPQAGVTYNWYTAPTGNTVLFSGTSFTTPVLSANTTYYVEGVNAGGCISARIAANVTILPGLTNNNITAPGVTSFCLAGDPANITGSTPAGGNNVYTYQWQQSTDNITFTNISGATAIDYDPAAITVTTYYRRTVSSGPCTTPLISNSLTFSILTPPTIPPTVQPTVTVCPGSPASLSVNNPQNGFTYNWYDSPSKTNLLFTGINYTTVPLLANTTFYVESSNGLCSGSSMAMIQVNMSTPPAAPALVKDTVITCSESMATFAIANPQTGFIYNWYSSANGGTPISTGTTFTSPILHVNTVYYVDVTNTQGCISVTRSAANANLTPLPQFTTQDALVCPGSNATLAANTSDRNIAFTWYTTLTGGSPVSTGDTLSIPVVNANVTYYVEATNTLTGCVSAVRKIVQVQLLQPLAAPMPAVNSVTASSVTFDWLAVKGAITYMVSTDNGSSYGGPSSGAGGLTHTVSSLKQNQSVTLLVRAMGLTPCSLSANSNAVTGQALNQTDDIYVPNAFTPNGDGNNDVVYVHSEGIKTLNFYVYNQWGQMIFSSAEKNNGWDGTYKGAKEPLGVYTYFLKAVMNNGHEVNKKGTITLLK